MSLIHSAERVWLRCVYMAPFTPFIGDDFRGEEKVKPLHRSAAIGLALWIAGAGIAYGADRVMGARIARWLTAPSALYLIFAGLVDCFIAEKIKELDRPEPSVRSEDFSKDLTHAIGRGVCISMAKSGWMVYALFVSALCPPLQGVVAYRLVTSLSNTAR